MKSPEIPIKNENGLQFVISWSITLKIELWAPYTHWQTVLKGEVILRQKAYFGPDYSIASHDANNLYVERLKIHNMYIPKMLDRNCRNLPHLPTPYETFLV